MRLWRDHRLDAGILALAAVLLVGTWWQRDASDRWGSLLGAAALLVLLARRRYPLLASVAAFFGIYGASELAPQATGAEFFGILATFGVVGTLERRRDAIVGWVAGCAVLFASMSNNPYVGGAGDIALTLTFCTVIWAAGLLAAERGRQVMVEQERADEAVSTREDRVREATEQERARIAAELHDIVSHSLSIIVVQAVAARMDAAMEPTLTGWTGASVLWSRPLATRWPTCDACWDYLAQSARGRVLTRSARVSGWTVSLS